MRDIITGMLKTEQQHSEDKNMDIQGHKMRHGGGEQKMSETARNRADSAAVPSKNAVLANIKHSRYFH